MTRVAGRVLAVMLVLLTFVAVVGSWRQADLLDSTARVALSTDAFQEAARLSVERDLALQAALNELDAEEREELPEIDARLRTVLGQLVLVDGLHGEEVATLVTTEDALREPVADYLAALDAGRTEVASELLEEEIEPSSTALSDALAAEAAEHSRAYAADLERARAESRLLQAGTTATFLLGLCIVTAFALSSRSHRRVIETMAAQDSLTGLPNRAAFQARAEAALAAARGRPSGTTVLMMDLDGFKDVNDSLGHHAGDQLLVEVGRRLTGCVRGQDTVARLGGDEFAVLLVDADPSAGERTAERVAQALTAPFVVDEVSVDIEVSVGIATVGAGEGLEEVLRHADIAMYAAKEHRLGHTRYDPDQTKDTAGRLNLLGALRRALDAGEIELHYQPKLAVEDRRLIGAEALARWNHPTRGLLGPVEFIPVLEGTSLVHRFTAHVLDLALAQARVWRDSGRPVPVAVNVSTRCLLDPGFPDTVAQSLLSAGVQGDLLCLEITESTVMADPERALDVLRRIRALGVSTAIDDFGTGYSSMAYLKILPVDEIKVDRSFVRDMATDPGNHVLVESVVALGHNLGLSVVAEGVEDGPTLDALSSLGCDVAQGYYFARPLPADAFLDFVAEHGNAAAGSATA